MIRCFFFSLFITFRRFGANWDEMNFTRNWGGFEKIHGGGVKIIVVKGSSKKNLE